MLARRRSGSLELDYGEDDPLESTTSTTPQIKQESQSGVVVQPPEIKPIATLETVKKEFTERKPIIAPPSLGLPANPLTGKVPTTAGSSSVLPSSSMNMNNSSGGGGGGQQMTAVFISDMHWWTSDQHLVELCHLAGAGGVRLKDVSFSEHKVNGKSKGVAYIETGSVEAASLVKRYLDQNEYQQKRMTCTPVIGSNLPSPFRTLPREPHSRNNQQSGGSHNPANQSSRPGLRIPPPCTYPYINSRDNGGTGSSSVGGGGSGGMGGAGGSNKRQHIGGGGNRDQQQQQQMGGMAMMGGGGGMNNNRNQNQGFNNNNNNNPSSSLNNQMGLTPQSLPNNNNGVGMMGFNGMGDPTGGV
ncbi:hypothetical protein JCM5350_007015, partial [Sporobolomyces pararoseus]